MQKVFFIGEDIEPLFDHCKKDLSARYFHNGESGFLSAAIHLPQLIILSENTQSLAQTEFLSSLKSTKELKDIPVIALVEQWNMQSYTSLTLLGAAAVLPLSEDCETLKGFIKEKLLSYLSFKDFIKKAEQERFSKQIHDGVQNSLVILSHQLQLLEKDLETGDLKKEKFPPLYLQIDKTIEELRNISYDLIPEKIEEFGLYELLKDYKKELDQITSITFRFELDAEVNSLSLKTKSLFYFFIKEAITNALKHAFCSAISVNGTFQQQQFVLEVADNGVGINPEKIFPGTGLSNIFRKVNQLGGHFEINGKQGEGTSLTLSIEF